MRKVGGMHDIFLLLSTEIRIKKHVLGIGLASFNFFHMQAEYLPLTFSVFEFNCFRRFLTFWNSGLFLLLSRQYQYAGFFTWIKLLILLFTHGGSLYRHKYPFYGEWNKMKSFRQFFFLNELFHLHIRLQMSFPRENIWWLFCYFQYCKFRVMFEVELNTYSLGEQNISWRNGKIAT